MQRPEGQQPSEQHTSPSLQQNFALFPASPGQQRNSFGQQGPLSPQQ